MNPAEGEGVSPACAGMILEHGERAILSKREPRMRGDDPGMGLC